MSQPNADAERPDAAPARITGGQLAADVAIYTIARLGLVVVLAALIIVVGKLFGVSVPLLIAAIFAVLVALPLSLYVFGALRRKVAASIAQFDEQRRNDRADLAARLQQESGR